MAIWEADNLDAFNYNFPYRRTGRGLRVIFPEAGNFGSGAAEG